MKTTTKHKNQRQKCLLSMLKKGRYACDSQGNIYSFSKLGCRAGGIHKLNPHPNRKGYLQTVLSAGDGTGTWFNVSVHQFVFLAFNGPYDTQKQINHLDGNKLNNSLNNLELITASANMLHAYKTGLKSLKGTQCGTAKLDDEKVRYIRRSYAEGGVRQADLAAKFNVSQAVISAVLLRKTWHHI